MAAIIFLAILVRRPFNSNSGVDEAFYLVVGRQWLNGTPPYAGTFDVKPPLLFLLMAAAEALFGFTLWAAKALATAAVATTACGLYLFGRRFTGELAGAAAAILYIVSALTLGGTFSPAELIMAPFTTFGMLTGLAAVFGRSRSELPTLLLSGLLFGAAACVKQTALFEAAALGAALALSRQGGARLRAFGAFATGLGAVPIGFAMYFLAIGHLGDLINDAGISAIRRAGAGYLPWGKAFELLLIGTLAVFAGRFDGRKFMGKAAPPALPPRIPINPFSRGVGGRYTPRGAGHKGNVRDLHSSSSAAAVPGKRRIHRACAWTRQIA